MSLDLIQTILLVVALLVAIVAFVKPDVVLLAISTILVCVALLLPLVWRGEAGV